MPRRSSAALALHVILLTHGGLCPLGCGINDDPWNGPGTKGGDSESQQQEPGGAQGGGGARNGAQNPGRGGDGGVAGFDDSKGGSVGAGQEGGSAGIGVQGGSPGVGNQGGSPGAGHQGGAAGVARQAGGARDGGAQGRGGRSGPVAGNGGGSMGGGLGLGAGGSALGAGGSALGAGGSDGPELQWRKANLTNYESYPDPGSEECREYNGCLWAGQFAALDGVQPESWVSANNIIAVHSKDFNAYKLKTLRLRMGTKQIDAKVYDMCSDSDCDGCCTSNSKETGFLIDIEKYTMERFGAGDGIVDWACVDCR